MTDFSKNKPVCRPHNKELRDKLADELMYISHHPKEYAVSSHWASVLVSGLCDSVSTFHTVAIQSSNE